MALLSLALIIAVLIHGTNIQSVDEYYLTHIDDITPQSETVFISIRCDTVLQNYDELDKVLQSDKRRYNAGNRICVKTRRHRF